MVNCPPLTRGTELYVADAKPDVEFDDQEDIELESGDSHALGDEDNDDVYSAKFKQQSSLGLSFYLSLKPAQQTVGKSLSAVHLFKNSWV